MSKLNDDFEYLSQHLFNVIATHDRIMSNPQFHTYAHTELERTLIDAAATARDLQHHLSLAKLQEKVNEQIRRTQSEMHQPR